MLKTNRWLPIVCGVVLTLALSSASALAALSFSWSLGSSDATLAETLLIGAASLYFGLDSKISAQYQSDTGSATSTVSALFLAGESQTSPDIIIADRQKGRGWGALAKGKMPPGLVKKWKGGADPFAYNDADFETGVSIHFLSTYYSVPADSITLWVKQGLSVSDVAVVLNLSSRANVKPTVIVEARLKGDSWTRLAARYRISIELLKEPVPPKVKYNKSIPPGLAKKGGVPPGQAKKMGK